MAHSDYYYNDANLDSIVDYAKKLEGRVFLDIIEDYDAYGISYAKENKNFSSKNAKGSLGHILEQCYFHYDINSNSAPDFDKVGLELKTTAYKINKNETKSAKERLVLTMINYFEIVDENFDCSHLLDKCQLMLLIFYLYDKDIKDKLNFKIDYVKLFSFPENDLKIIKSDFYKIKNKIAMGEAHNLSESDTIYLGACTKSSSSKILVKQPNSKLKAKPRAFSLKSSYMTYILRNYVINESIKDDTILKEFDGVDFEKYVLNILDLYIGKRDEDLFKEFFYNFNINSKDKYSRLAFELLGVRTENAEEFNKANIVVKAIRIEENNNVKESMSFPCFKIKDLVNQNWETSDIYNYFNKTRFLFICYKKRKDGYYLDKAQFWNMPIEDIEGSLKKEWLEIVDTFKAGVKLEINYNKSPVKNNLPKKSKSKILHVRPHAFKAAYLIEGVQYGNGKLSRDSDLLPNGDRMTKQSFWLNNKYIKKQILK